MLVLPTFNLNKESIIMCHGVSWSLLAVFLYMFCIFFPCLGLSMSNILRFFLEFDCWSVDYMSKMSVCTGKMWKMRILTCLKRMLNVNLTHESSNAHLTYVWKGKTSDAVVWHTPLHDSQCQSKLHKYATKTFYTKIPDRLMTISLPTAFFLEVIYT